MPRQTRERPGARPSLLPAGTPPTTHQREIAVTHPPLVPSVSALCLPRPVFAPSSFDALTCDIPTPLRLPPSGCQRSDRHQVCTVRIIVAVIPRVSHPRSTGDLGSLPNQMFKHKAHRQYNLPLPKIQLIARTCAQAGPQRWAPALRAWWPWVSE